MGPINPRAEAPNFMVSEEEAIRGEEDDAKMLLKRMKDFYDDLDAHPEHHMVYGDMPHEACRKAVDDANELIKFIARRLLYP